MSVTRLAPARDRTQQRDDMAAVAVNLPPRMAEGEASERTLADVFNELAGLRADIREIKRHLERRSRPTRDDGRLLQALFAASPDCVFSTAEMLTHARLHGDLADALAAAGIETARQLGKALQRCVERSVGGVVVRRHGVDHHGTIWSLSSESEGGVTNSHSGSGAGV